MASGWGMCQFYCNAVKSTTLIPKISDSHLQTNCLPAIVFQFSWAHVGIPFVFNKVVNFVHPCLWMWISRQCPFHTKSWYYPLLPVNLFTRGVFGAFHKFSSLLLPSRLQWINNILSLKLISNAENDHILCFVQHASFCGIRVVWMPWVTGHLFITLHSQ